LPAAPSAEPKRQSDGGFFPTGISFKTKTAFVKRNLGKNVFSAKGGAAGAAGSAFPGLFDRRTFHHFRLGGGIRHFRRFILLFKNLR
jgi:hypothetical protein